jgi:hypothetical protein
MFQILLCVDEDWINETGRGSIVYFCEDGDETWGSAKAGDFFINPVSTIPGRLTHHVFLFFFLL